MRWTMMKVAQKRVSRKEDDKMIVKWVSGLAKVIEVVDRQDKNDAADEEILVSGLCMDLLGKEDLSPLSSESFPSV